MKYLGCLSYFVLLFNTIYAGVTGYNNVGNGNTKFIGSEATTISVLTGSASSFDAIIKATSFDDFEFNCGTVTIDETASAGKAGIIFRYTNSSNYYAVTNHWDRWATGNYIIRLKNSNLSGFNSSGDIASYSSSSTITSLKILAQGSSIKVWVNGTLRIDVTDSNHSSGSYGFAHHTLWNSLNASWSNVSWGASPLPVDLLNFDATLQKDNVLVHWQTAVEINNDYFILEKSDNGKQWQQIHEVSGAGNTAHPQYYHFVDYGGCNNVCYYRLKQVDFDGSTETFNSVVVTNSSNQNSSPTIFPNPVNDVVRLRNLSNVSLIRMFDTKGKLILSESILPGAQNYQLNVSFLTPGSYKLVLSGVKTNQVSVIVKL